MCKSYFIFCLLVFSTFVVANPPNEWLTRAERTSFQETPRYDETVDYCKKLMAASPWQREVFRRLDASFIPEIPEEGDWRRPVDVSEEAWHNSKAELDFSLHQIVNALNDMAKTADENKEPGITLAPALSGLVQHNAYHSGQIAVLRKVLRGAQ